MKLETEELDGGVLKVNLEGRMDIAGTDAIAVPLASLAATDNRRVILDLSDVDFLASIGVRAILQKTPAPTRCAAGPWCSWPRDRTSRKCSRRRGSRTWCRSFRISGRPGPCSRPEGQLIDRTLDVEATFGLPPHRRPLDQGRDP